MAGVVCVGLDEGLAICAHDKAVDWGVGHGFTLDSKPNIEFTSMWQMGRRTADGNETDRLCRQEITGTHLPMTI